MSIPEQDPDVRIKNFDEVCLGYTKKSAINEAARCLQCPQPKCVKGCPVHIDIPGFIKYIKENDNNRALESIKETNNLPAICGRVCPQETQCEKACILASNAINIGKLERYAADNGRFSSKPKPPDGKKVAIVGSGPAALTCAADLSGFGVTVFEALHKPGGVLTYGIPEFRLPNSIVEEEIDHIKKLGVKFKLNTLVGRTITLKQLTDNYDAVFIATGAGLPHFMDIPGENLNYVYSANEFLTRVNLMYANKFPNSDTPIKKFKHMVVVGGGNVAIDAARVARRLGSNVTVIYRRSEKEMPARVEEIHHAKEEGIIFEFLANPVKILGAGHVSGVECIRMKLGEPDSSGRRRPMPIDGSEFNIPTESVIVAVGQGSNPLIADIKVNKWNNIIVDDNMKTSLDKVYAGGDIVSGASTVISAMADGKKAAKAIIEIYK